MGYKPKRVTYALEFEDDDLAGLEVEVRSVTLDQYLAVVGARRLANLPSRQWDDDDTRAMAGLYDALAAALVSWNVEDEDDEPVPATRDGVYSQDITLMLPIGLAWLNAMGGGIPEGSDLGKDSAPGPNALEASIPMDVSSTSPSN